jgi:hypothetical protein
LARAATAADQADGRDTQRDDGREQRGLEHHPDKRRGPKLDMGSFGPRMSPPAVGPASRASASTRPVCGPPASAGRPKRRPHVVPLRLA